MSKLLSRVANVLSKKELLKKIPVTAYSVVNHINAPRRNQSNWRTDHSVSRFSIPDRSTLDKDIQERLDTEEEKAGFLPHVLTFFARRPAEFRNFFSYYDTLIADREGGSLTKAEKELLITVTSARNNCLYCTVAHGALHRLYSKRPLVTDQASIAVDHADLSPRERAIVDLAVKITEMKPVTEEDIDRMAEHGVDREDVWDIGAVTSFFAMSNRFAHFAALMPNEEFYNMGRIQKRED